MKYLFDTTAYSQLLKGHKDVANTLKNAENILMPSVVIAELRYGFMLGAKREENEKLLTRFIANKKIRVILPDNATTDYFVNIAVIAHKKGVQLSTHDLWIVALTEQWDVTLVTFDNVFKHLDYKKKLQLEN